MPLRAVLVRCFGLAGSRRPLFAVLVGVLLLGAVVPPVGAAGESEVSPLSVREIASGVWLHVGHHVVVGAPGHDDIANIGFIVGERCVAVIDTGGSVAVGRRLLAALRGVTGRPVCYVINTHIHFDHLLGNAAFNDGSARFVGHAELGPAVIVNREFFARSFPSSLGGLPPEQAVPDAPQVSVQSTLELDLGGRLLLLKAWPPAHTQNDLSVLDQGSGVLWTGDLLFRERLPVLDGSLGGWLGALEALPGPGVRMIVPGHGSPAEDWESAAAAQHAYLLELRASVLGWLDQGLFLEQVLEQAGAHPPSGEWLFAEELHRRNASRAYTELEWQ